ncbi:MAG: FAD-dependent oxidoreductase [Planctomycetota bacterium]
MRTRTQQLDTLVVGGGIAGLWILDRLVAHGHACALVEADTLGRGQTLWSQGILHGGVKYALAGTLTASAAGISEMPGRWTACLAGSPRDEDPDLSGVVVRSDHCHLWRTDSIASRVGMLGAKLGLAVTPTSVATQDRPVALREVPGSISRLDECVVDPVSLVRVFHDRHAERIARVPIDQQRWTIESDHVRFDTENGGVNASRVVLAAGNGNADIRAQLGLASNAMQVRDLHMVLVRGSLPPLNGHCTDGSKTRLTITSIDLHGGRRVWQVGGELAERGVEMDAPSLIAFAQRELRACLPGVEFTGCEWATYRAPRAEARTASGRRHDLPVVLEEGRVLTVWPSKLVLAPMAADIVADRFPATGSGAHAPAFESLEVPQVGAPPWDEPREWVSSATT